MSVVQEQLAQLAAEYERSRAFLHGLETSVKYREDGLAGDALLPPEAGADGDSSAMATPQAKAYPGLRGKVSSWFQKKLGSSKRADTSARAQPVVRDPVIEVARTPSIVSIDSGVVPYEAKSPFTSYGTSRHTYSTPGLAAQDGQPQLLPAFSFHRISLDGTAPSQRASSSSTTSTATTTASAARSRSTCFSAHRRSNDYPLATLSCSAELRCSSSGINNTAALPPAASCAGGGGGAPLLPTPVATRASLRSAVPWRAFSGRRRSVDSARGSRGVPAGMGSGGGGASGGRGGYNAGAGAGTSTAGGATLPSLYGSAPGTLCAVRPSTPGGLGSGLLACEGHHVLRWADQAPAAPQAAAASTPTEVQGRRRQPSAVSRRTSSSSSCCAPLPSDASDCLLRSAVSGVPSPPPSPPSASAQRGPAQAAASAPCPSAAKAPGGGMPALLTAATLLPAVPGTWGSGGGALGAVGHAAAMSAGSRRLPPVKSPRTTIDL